MRRFAVTIVILGLLVGLISTWPLAPDFFSAIPYTQSPVEDYEKVPLMPGDHLQTYYWFWLFSDNITGTSQLLTNPYEFNAFDGPMSAGYANFPFSILYWVLLFLGQAGAYNGLILLSFALGGLACFLLARSLTQDNWAALFAGFVFAYAPFRVGHVVSGHLFAFVIFLLPLGLFFMEKAIQRSSWIYGLLSGACLALVSLMEGQVAYLMTLTLGAYLAGRILLAFPKEDSLTASQPGSEVSLPFAFTGVLIGGVCLGVFSWMVASRKAGFDFFDIRILPCLGAWLLACILIWFFVAALFSLFTRLDFVTARNLVGRQFFCLTPLVLYGVQYNLDIPKLGPILLGVSLIGFVASLTRVFVHGKPIRQSIPFKKYLPAVLGFGSGLLVAASYLLHVRSSIFVPSIAGKGRSLNEVLLYAPNAIDFIKSSNPDNERFIFLGITLIFLSLLSLMPLFGQMVRKKGTLILASGLAFLASVLALGPNLTGFPLYELLYKYFPFFKYPRVPGRYVMVAFVFMGVLAAFSLSDMRQYFLRKGKSLQAVSIVFAALLLIGIEFYNPNPVGLALFNAQNSIYAQISKELPNDKVVLELPIWPGDSHQSSAYEYTVTRTQKPMVNGYSPVVAKEYVEKVFWPLFPLDLGQMTASEADLLKRLKVGLVTFHDDANIYANKISSFPPRLALLRLMASPYLKPLGKDGVISLFKLRDKPLGQKDPKEITVPVNSVWYARSLPHETGRRVMVPNASGYNLLMEEGPLLKNNQYIPKPNAYGNVISAKPGKDKPGFLAFGPFKAYPAGRYLARFRLKVGPFQAGAQIGRLEVTTDKGKTILAQRPLLAGELPADQWADAVLEFTLDSFKDLEFRVFYNAKAALDFNLVNVGFSNQKQGPRKVEAENLLRQTGWIVQDDLAGQKEAVLGKAGYHPPLYLTHGPYLTFAPGCYKAEFFMRLSENALENQDVALLEIATDLGKKIFTKKIVKTSQLSKDAYKSISLEFKVPFRCEVGFRTKFIGKTSVLIDKIEAVPCSSK